MGDTLIWKLASAVVAGEWLWLAAAERSYLIVDRAVAAGYVTFTIERASGTRVILPPMPEDDAVELEVMT